jgi:hypothetical protein
MKKILALSLAVVFLFGFTGFDWGNSSDQPDETKKPAAPPPTASTADGLTALNNLLGSGTPAERQAKLDTLVRLSQILPVVAPAAATAPAPAATEPVQKTSKKTKKSSW